MALWMEQGETSSFVSKYLFFSFSATRSLSIGPWKCDIQANTEWRRGNFLTTYMMYMSLVGLGNKSRTCKYRYCDSFLPLYTAYYT